MRPFSSFAGQEASALAPTSPPAAQPFAEAIEAFVDLVEPQAVGEQLVDRHAAGPEQGEEIGQRAAPPASPTPVRCGFVI
jgi:hypothetical protein